MQNKGFTLVELLGVIVVLAILGGIAVFSITGLVSKQRNKVYKNYESTLKTTVENYMINDFKNNGSLMPTIGNSTTITVETLKSKKLLNSLKDPSGGTCDTSYVVVTRNNDNGINLSLNYKVCLICPNYRSKNC